MKNPPAHRDISNERIRQDTKWGIQTYHPFWWLCILMEELGELAQEVRHICDATAFDGAAPISRLLCQRAEHLGNVVFRQLLEDSFERGLLTPGEPLPTSLTAALRSEAIHVAAVAQALAECLDRNIPKPLPFRKLRPRKTR